MHATKPSSHWTKKALETQKGPGPTISGRTGALKLMASRVFPVDGDAKKHEKDDKDGNVYDYRKKHLPPRPINETRKLQADEQDLQRSQEGESVAAGFGFSAQKITT